MAARSSYCQVITFSVQRAGWGGGRAGREVSNPESQVDKILLQPAGPLHLPFSKSCPECRQVVQPTSEFSSSWEFARAGAFTFTSLSLLCSYIVWMLAMIFFLRILLRQTLCCSGLVSFCLRFMVFG